MRSAMIDHVIERIGRAPVKKEPFSHFYLDRVFPDDFYQELIESLPDLSEFQPISMDGAVRKGTYVQRVCLSLEKERLAQLPFGHRMFWSRLAESLTCEPFIAML